MDNIWPTMVVGSIGEVGSCACNSVTSRFRNVCCRLDEDVLDEPLEPEEPDVPLVLAIGRAEFALCPATGAVTVGMKP